MKQLSDDQDWDAELPPRKPGGQEPPGRGSGGGPSENGTVDPRQAAVTAAIVVAGIAVLVAMRPRLAGTIAVMLSIVLMIMLHEFGHFVMAKRAGMKVTEFFLGFGPKIWSFRRGETEYGVKAIPAGGYVRIIGMNNLEEVDPADEERTYRAKPYRHRLAVAVAGSTMHFIIAFVLLFSVFAFVGDPFKGPHYLPVVGQVIDDSPAAASDFRVGDRIVAINGVAMKDWEDVPRYVEKHGEKRLVFTVSRGGTEKDIPILPRMVTQGNTKVPRVGLAPKVIFETKSIPAAFGATVTKLPDLMGETVTALGKIFSPSGVSNYGDLMSGKGGSDDTRLLSPVGATRVAGDAVDGGWGPVLMFLIAINIFVGIFNMVPLLPLDGGHVAISTYEKIASMVTKRRVVADVRKLMPITAVVVGLLVIIGVSALYLDIVKPIQMP